MQQQISYTLRPSSLKSFQIPKSENLSSHKQLKNPSFSELNQKINEYPASPLLSVPTTRPPSQSVKPTPNSSASRDRTRFKHENSNTECTFQPKINYLQTYKNYSMSSEQKLKLLARPKNDEFEKREKIKRKNDIEEALKFNYTPEISKFQLKQQIPITERIYEKDLKLKHREKLKRMEEEKYLEECTFHPKINKARVKDQEEPIYKRAESVELKKVKNLIKIKQEMEKNMSFTPVIDKKSRAISAHTRKLQKELHSCRSSQFFEYNQGRNSVDIGDLDRIFIPTRNFYDFSDFFQRQDKFKTKKQLEIEKYYSEFEKTYNFKPTINKNSSFIIETSKSPQPLLEKMQKLSEDNLKKIENQEKIRKNYYSRFNFEPKINEISKKIGRKSSLDDLSKNSKKIDIRKAKQEILEREKMENCTFSPNINSKLNFSHIKSSYNQTEKILTNIEEENKKKSEKIKVEKYKRDYEELEKCSFKPIIHENAILKKNQHKIKGLDRFFELKEMSKRLYTERESHKSIFSNFSSHYKSSSQGF